MCPKSFNYKDTVSFFSVDDRSVFVKTNSSDKLRDYGVALLFVEMKNIVLNDFFNIFNISMPHASSSGFPQIKDDEDIVKQTLLLRL